MSGKLLRRMAVSVLAVSLVVANAQGRVRDSFETQAVGASILNAGGWSGGPDDVARVTNVPYTVPGGYLLAGSHTNVMEFSGSISNTPAGRIVSPNTQEARVAFAIKAERQNQPAAGESGILGAFCLNESGLPLFWAKGSGGAPEWLSVTNTAAAADAQAYPSESWLQAEILFNFTQPDQAYVRLTVNGVALKATDESLRMAKSGPGFAPSADGDWMKTGRTPEAGQMGISGFIAMGSGLLDDVILEEPNTALAGDDLQALVNAAAPGSTLYLGAGLYTGNLVLNKALTLVGSSSIIAGNVTLDSGSLSLSGIALADGFHWTVTPNSSIQAAIALAAAGDTIHVAAGVYPEQVQLTKRVNLVGAGMGLDGAILRSPVTPAVVMAASGLSAEAPVTVRGFRIDGQAFGTAVELGGGLSWMRLADCWVRGGNVGIRAGTGADIQHLQFEGLTFSGNKMDVVLFTRSAPPGVADDILFRSCTFGGADKGIYVEKFSNALITNCLFASVATNFSYDWSAAIDLNLKYGDYSNIVISACAFTNCGVGALQGAAIAIKARGTGTDSSYASRPATLTGVTVTGCTIVDCERGIRIGEPGKTGMTGPTGLLIEGNWIAGNTLRHPAPTSPGGDLVNLTTVPVPASENYWGSAAPAWSTQVYGLSSIVSYYADSALTDLRYLQVYVDDDFTSGTPGWGVSRFATIQGGIDAVAAGGTVTVGPGSYDGKVTLAKGVRLLSSEGWAATTIRNSAGTGLATVQLVGPTTGVQVGDVGHGFTIVGIDSPSAGIEYAAIYLQGAHTDTRIIGNRIEAAGDSGLSTETAALSGLVITDNEFTGQTFVGPNPAGEGFGEQFTLWNVPRQLVVVQGSGGPVTFSRNILSGTAGGTNTLGQAQGNNLVTIDTAGATIQDNVFSGLTTRSAHALRIGGVNDLVSGNVFTGLTPVGLFVRAAAGATALVTGNSFSGFGVALVNGGTAMLQASSNWWGSAGGPLAALNQAGTGGAVGANVDFSPWLGDGADTNPDLIGFQPNGELAYFTPVSLVFATQPVGASLGSALAQQPVLEVLDENGDLAVQYVGLVTVAIGANTGVPNLGVLDGALAVQISGGRAVFTDLAMTRGCGTNFTLTASALGLSTATSAVFNISNNSPVLPDLEDRTVAEQAPLTFTIAAADPDIPSQALMYTLDVESVAALMSLDPQTGVFTWTPTEAHGGRDFTVTVTVTDNGANPVGTDSESFVITVTETNSAPTLEAIPSRTANFGETVTFTASASDPDLPAQNLRFRLIGAPAGAMIDPVSGLFAWTPTAEQAASNHVFTVTVEDDGTPAMSHSREMSITLVAATQDCPGFRSPSTNMTVSGRFVGPVGRSIQFLAWRPELPAEWSLLSVSGDAQPAVSNNGWIAFTGAFASNAVAFTCTVSVPGSQAVSNTLGGQVAFTLAGVDPAVLPVPAQAIYRYHSADYRSLFRQIDSTEMNRVLSYWRAGGYAYDTRGYDGYVAASQPGPGIENLRHSADYQSPYGRIDVQEVALVQEYWRAGGYHVDPLGADGYAYNRSGIGPRIASLGLPLFGFQEAGSFVSEVTHYNPGQLLVFTNTFVPPPERLLSLYWRLSLPEGWTLVSATGDGAPIVDGNDILLTAMNLPTTPISVVCTVRVPLTEVRECAFTSVVRYKADGMIRSLALSNTAPRLAALDGDGNGLADSWERVYSSAGPLDPNADPDGDTKNNRDEYLCGTIPTDPASVLQMLGLSFLPDGRVQVSWSSVAGRVYTLQRADGSPEADRFTDIQVGIPAEGSGQNVLPDQADPATPCFYRVKLQ